MGGLKIRLTITISVLIFIAVLLGNLITVIFTQRSLVKSELVTLEILVDHFFEDISKSKFNLQNFNAHQLCRSFNHRCELAGFYSDSSKSLASTGRFEEPLKQLIRGVEADGNRQVEVYGTVLEAFLNGERYLMLADKADPGDDSEIFFIIWSLSPVYNAIKADQQIILVYLLVNVLLLSVIGFFRLANLVIRPIDRLINMADQYQVTNSVFYSETKVHSEFSQLSAALTNMLKRIESDRDALRENVKALEKSNLEIKDAHREIVQAEKLASVGRLSAGFAHEIGNPITIIHGYVELLKSSEIDDQQKQVYGNKALDELERINKLVRQLLNYARETGKESEEVVFDSNLLEGVVDIVNLEKKRAHIKIESDVEPGLTCSGSREAVRQVLLNCLLNAIDALEERGGEAEEEGLIVIKGYRKQENDTDTMVVEISDNGAGLSEDQVSHAFDPFYSTKPIGKGTGLGLYVSHLIVESFGGQMRIEANVREGATVIIELPICGVVKDGG